jgi:YegS/Rv2252/BmrU family lipid kinase
VAGGDGTINEAVQSLVHSNTALGYLPYGTVNVWAREMGIPLDTRGAAHALLDGRIERVDLGLAADRYFLLSAGIGFDGAVVRKAEVLERHKHRLGILPYVMAGLSMAPRYRGADLELRYDGVIRRVEALMLVVANTRLYGGYFELTPGAVANDGWLDLCIIKGRGVIALARQTLSVVIFRSVAHSDVEMIRVKEVTVSANRQLWMQLDGELAGQTPVEFSIVPKALRVIVPEGLSTGLIAS